MIVAAGLCYNTGMLWRPIAALVFCLAAAPVLAADAVTFSFLNASRELYGRPHDLVLSPDGAALYVSDLGNDRIAVLDPETLDHLGQIGGGDLSSPHDVAFDAAGRLLVADTGNHRVAIYEVSGAGGKLVGELTGGLEKPEGVAVAPDGRVYVANAGSHHIAAFKDGQKIAQVGKRGDGPLEFVRPHDIHVTPEGWVVVADPGNNRLQVLDLELAYQGDLGGESYDFNEPKYFDYGPAGWIVVADEYNHVLKVIGPEGKLITVFGEGRPAKGPNRFNYPEGVEVAGENLWVADTRNGRIVRYRIQGLP